MEPMKENGSGNDKAKRKPFKIVFHREKIEGHGGGDGDNGVSMVLRNVGEMIQRVRLLLCLCLKDHIVKLSWDHACLLQLQLERGRTRNILRRSYLSMELQLISSLIRS
ncbi:hypothetical protein V6N11_081785 [Hibiscus sabdariffa]|uniref:Uncharacterized protein n=1 Tax=Hibiscus sabdariffa TaxID=183260 RepID=A0ABR2Q7J8_9ROSI